MNMIFLFFSDQQKDTVFMRDTSLQMFFCNIDKSGIEEIQKSHKSTPLKNICEWSGITCHNETVTVVRYNRFSHGNFSVGFLPNSVHVVDISSCNQSFAIDTRMFPKSVMHVSLSTNMIHGRIDLQCLPLNLTHGYFFSNQLSGPISLLRLPRKLKELSLFDNCLDQKVLWYDDLPADIKISLTGFWGKRGIKETRPIDPEKTADRSTFTWFA